ncbi:MAG TPA: alpha/beta fold hydrolase [Solirubrobacterales bacterium]|nr:alpha/beta fold hydrolase [Solirubrobacterales bacterium]
MSRSRALRWGAEPPSRAETEGMLEPATRLVLEAGERNPGLAALDLDGALGRVEHEWAPHQGLRIHLERHEVDPAAPTVVVAPGLGDHARRQLGLAAGLAELGMNSMIVDRRGHGLSEGRRGDAPLEVDLDVLELAIGIARARSGGPVVLLGDSLGGILSWYLLTREPDVDAAVCHCISHPDVDLGPSYRFKAPLMRALGLVLPYAPIPVERIADYGHVALDPLTRRYFDERVDPLFNFTVTARSAASYLRFVPGVDWSQVAVPALVLIGAADRMVTPAFTRRALERSRPPRAEYIEIDGAGHQLFLDHLGAVLGPLGDWMSSALGERDRTAAGGR